LYFYNTTSVFDGLDPFRPHSYGKTERSSKANKSTGIDAGDAETSRPTLPFTLPPKQKGRSSYTLESAAGFESHTWRSREGLGFNALFFFAVPLYSQLHRRLEMSETVFWFLVLVIFYLLIIISK